MIGSQTSHTILGPAHIQVISLSIYHVNKALYIFKKYTHFNKHYQVIWNVHKTMKWDNIKKILEFEKQACIFEYTCMCISNFGMK